MDRLERGHPVAMDFESVGVAAKGGQLRLLWLLWADSGTYFLDGAFCTPAEYRHLEVPKQAQGGGMQVVRRDELVRGR